MMGYMNILEATDEYSRDIKVGNAFNMKLPRRLTRKRRSQPACAGWPIHGIAWSAASLPRYTFASMPPG